MKFFKKQKNNIRGFTLIETMVSVVILSSALFSLLSLTSSSLFSARYANNEITASYLLQEAVDYVRNDRDSFAFQQSNNGAGPGGWIPFLNKYGNYTLHTNCYSPDGCWFDVTNTTQTITSCSAAVSSPYTTKCPPFYYDINAGTDSNKSFYNYNSGFGSQSIFKRKVYMIVGSNPQELDIVATVEWVNGSVLYSRSLRTSLLEWGN